MFPCCIKAHLVDPPKGSRLSAAACCLLVLAAGCPAPDLGEDDTVRTPLAGIKLRLLVVDDPQIGAAIGALKGEWNALTGCELQLESMTGEKLAAAERLQCDAVICPSHLLGPLAERRLLARLPRELVQQEGSHWSGVFDLLRLRESGWGPNILAVSFGSPLLVCYYRADLLETLERSPPQTWQQYQELAESLGDLSKLGNAAGIDRQQWSGTIEPLGPGWAGLVLLARAAAYAKHRENYSALFNIATMEPLVAGPPFVRALEELVAAASTGSPGQLQFDPEAVRAAFWQGKSAMALTWPTAAAQRLRENAAGAIRVGFSELPGSGEVYDVGNQAWEARPEEDDPRVPLLAAAGRIGVVVESSAHQQAAFQLLLWLSGEEISPAVCSSSPATTLFRQSHAASPQSWVEPPVSPTEAAQYATVLQAAFRRPQWLFALRIPGRPEYLSALDEAVQQAVSGEQSASGALRQAADRWKQITARYGTDNQKAAYLHSLGLE